MTIVEQIDRDLEAGGLRGFVHAIDVESGAAIGLREGEPVVLASVLKIAVLAELHRRFDGGHTRSPAAHPSAGLAEDLRPDRALDVEG